MSRSAYLCFEYLCTSEVTIRERHTVCRKRLSLTKNCLSSLSGLLGGDQAGNDRFRSDRALQLWISMNDLTDLPCAVGYLLALRQMAMDGNLCQGTFEKQRSPSFRQGVLAGASKRGRRRRRRRRRSRADKNGVGSGGGKERAGGTTVGARPVTGASSRVWRAVVNDTLAETRTLSFSDNRLGSLPEELRDSLTAADSWGGQHPHPPTPTPMPTLLQPSTSSSEVVKR